MPRDRACLRRAFLAAIGSGTATALAGCGAVSGAQSDDGGDSGPPVVDNGADEDRTVEINLAVVGEDGTGKSDVEVHLHDRGGTPDDRVGRTGPEGRLVFLESVGPEPCNRLWLTLPTYDVREPLGCLNGNTTVERTLHVEERSDSEGPEQPDDPDQPEQPDGPQQPDDPTGPAEPVEYPVVDNGADTYRRNLVIDVDVVGAKGEPAGSLPIELEDRGGTPDDRHAETGPNGRIRFIESVGPPPCNSQTLKLPDAGVQKSLGCNNGGQHISVTLQRDGGQSDPAPGGLDEVEYPVVDNGSDDPQRMVVVDLELVSGRGEPMGQTEVLLQDRGGTPDDRRGVTGPEGRIRFLESVGPPPCNTQTVIVPDYDVKRSLGCNNGYTEIEERIVIED